jgi:hypothetical protein
VAKSAARDSLYSERLRLIIDKTKQGVLGDRSELCCVYKKIRGGAMFYGGIVRCGGRGASFPPEGPVTGQYSKIEFIQGMKREDKRVVEAEKRRERGRGREREREEEGGGGGGGRGEEGERGGKRGGERLNEIKILMVLKTTCGWGGSTLVEAGGRGWDGGFQRGNWERG